jgi:hypothetical protein
MEVIVVQTGTYFVAGFSLDPTKTIWMLHREKKK